MFAFVYLCYSHLGVLSQLCDSVKCRERYFPKRGCPLHKGCIQFLLSFKQKVGYIHALNSRRTFSRFLDCAMNEGTTYPLHRFTVSWHFTEQLRNKYKKLKRRVREIEEVTISSLRSFLLEIKRLNRLSNSTGEWCTSCANLQGTKEYTPTETGAIASIILGMGNYVRYSICSLSIWMI